ncbi:MAG: ABC transporter permease [Clostridiales bacterium]|nr:ABC transporter permease [Clostridiales bacterium]
MKVSFFYALSEIRRRPKRFIAMVAVAASVLTILIMMLLSLDADWRAQVMPDNEDNYHFSIYDLRESEKEYIKRQPWVQAWYDKYHYDKYGNVTYNYFCVRVTWDEVLRMTRHAYDIFDEFDIWSRKNYADNYERLYAYYLKMIQNEWAGAPESTLLPTGYTIGWHAANSAKIDLLMDRVKNRSFCSLTVNSYIIRPEFLLMMTLFEMFLGSAMMILTAERYKSLLREFGSLRSLGMKKKQIIAINCFDNLLISIASIPVGTIAAILIVKLYSLISRDLLKADSTYRTLLDSIPVPVIVFVSILMTIVSLIGCLLVCYFNRNRDIMDMLRGADDYKVSFVAKTSTRFERAKSSSIYSRLHLSRTRISFILSVAVMVIMLPLPYYYIMQSVFSTLPGSTQEMLAEGYYYIFQAVIIFITSMIVIYISTRSNADDRHHELGIMRSLGMKKRTVRSMVFTPLIVQILLIVPLSVLIFSELNSVTYTVPGTEPPEIGVIITAALALFMLVIPPIVLGGALSLHTFNRRSIMDGIRGITPKKPNKKQLDEIKEV